PDMRGRLLTGGGPELHDNLGRDAPAVFDVNALGPCPYADGGGVGRAGARPAPAAARPPGTGRRPPGRNRHTWPGACATPPRFRAQVDLIIRAVQPETHGSLGLAAVEVVNEQNLNLLRH